MSLEHGNASVCLSHPRQSVPKRPKNLVCIRVAGARSKDPSARFLAVFSTVPLLRGGAEAESGVICPRGHIWCSIAHLSFGAAGYGAKHAWLSLSSLTLHSDCICACRAIQWKHALSKYSS